jgi:putative nucleotidyltransferase with HDIG domain
MTDSQKPQTKFKILIVEDSEVFRSTLADVLATHFSVFEAPDGKEAREILSISQFDLVLSDIQMPFLNGVELLEWVKKNKTCKFILMTGFSHLLETKRATDLGADDFLAKPFDINELIKKIQNLLIPQKADEHRTEESKRDQDADYCKVPIEDFISEKNTEYGIYIRINSSRYIKIAHQGGRISNERCQQYKQNGVSFVYVKNSDFEKVVGFNLNLSKVLLKSAVDEDKKKRFLRYTGELILENTFVNGLNKDSFAFAKDFVEMSIKTMAQDSDVENVLNLLAEHSDFLYAHSLAVSTFAVQIGRALDWHSPITLFKLGAGGLFHDIGKKEIPRELLLKPRASTNQKERAQIETHTLRGKEILDSMKAIPSEVSRIAYEHHESPNGQGFPLNLTRNQIHPLTYVVGAANIFCNYVIKSPINPNPMTAKEAIAYMESSRADELDKQSLEALKSLFT